MLLSSKKNRINRRFIVAFSLFFVMGAIFLFPNYISAEELDLYGGGTAGVNEATLQEATGLSSTDPRVIAARVIQIALGFLAIIIVGLIIYGGWMYMTSEGNEERIQKAKDIIKNAVIGLIIVLSAFGITSFILGRLIGSSATGGIGSQGGPSFRSGFGAIGSCSVESVYPEDMASEVPRNTSIIVTFKEEIDPNTICGMDECNGEEVITDNVKIYMQDQKDSCFDDGNCASAKVYSNDNKTFAFIPNEYLGSASEYIWYEVYMTNDIKIQATGVGVFDRCNSNLNWIFEVSNKLDLTPPQVTTVFPSPDNWSDDYYDSDTAISAKGSITVNSNPQTLRESSTGNPESNQEGNKEAYLVDGFDSYIGNEEGTISVQIVNLTTFRSSSDDILCVSGEQSIVNNELDLGCGLKIRIEDDEYIDGNLWTIDVEQRIESDKLNIGGTLYSFVSLSPENNEILVGTTKESTAQNIANVLNSRSDVIAVVSDNVINIEAKTAGASGNDIVLASESSVLSISAVAGKLSGGVDRERREDIYGRKDKPRNIIIQINFDEPMMPMAISGSADEVNDYLKVVNANPTAKSSGEVCIDNNQCRSFSCVGGLCENDYLAGNFEIANEYKTVEFIPSTPCEGEASVNACGGRVYCLPGNANLKIELRASDLATCGGNQDCSSKSPYVNCSGTCQDSSTPAKNYPLGDSLTGIGDANSNSLDGDRNKNAEGPISSYNENNLYGLCDGKSICTDAIPSDFVISAINCSAGTCVGAQSLTTLQSNQGDNYVWSFYTSDQIAVGAPVITVTNPNLNGSNVNLSNSIKVEFNTLLMASTLRTGGIETVDPVDGSLVPHRQVNLWNYTTKALGYWITKEDIDDPRDNELDNTIVNINHSMFDDATTYRAQLGSGIKDIYQNCYLPSDGPACTDINNENPSCCSGVANATLDSQGNCQ